MRRREFIGLIGGAAAWPLAARAQQPPMPVIGFLRSTFIADVPHLVEAFRQGLKEEGYIDGYNVVIEFRFAENQLDRLPALVNDLVRRPVAVVVANGIAALTAKATTTTIPILFTTGSDPVRDGLVASLNRPGGNVTGAVFITGELGAKRLELLRQLVPAEKIAVLINPNTSETEAERKDIELAARTVGQQLIVADVSSVSDIEAAFAKFVQHGAGALFIGSGAFMFSNRGRLVALAAHYALPASYSSRDAVAAGGLMSYGTSNTDAFRQVGIYTGRVLKGEKPGELPVIRSAKLEIVINLNAARALGLNVPPLLLARADEVIE